MQFDMLGPLSVEANGRECVVSAPRQRVVLALLLCNANRVVSIDRIAAAVWDGGPPPSAASTVRTYVMRLRQVLGREVGHRIRTQAPGYLIELRDDETDLGRLTAHRARAAAFARSGELERASEEYAAALALWRGEPLVDIRSRTLADVEGRYLHELRLQTLESRLDADLALRRHTEILPELWREVRENPLREALVSRLMLALFRAGRQSEALTQFQLTRTALIDQLGAEPGSELREMQRRILAADDRPPGQVPGGMAGERERPPSSVRRWPKPAQLPARIPVLVGRNAERAELVRLLTTAEGTEGAAAVAVVTGAGGIGKTALALHAAHAVREHFGHGQLYADLGGRERPLPPVEVLRRFLVDLGVPEDEVPTTESQATLLYRSLTADRRILVGLDDARSAAQIRPLVPGGPGSKLLVTSRYHLADLDGAHPVRLNRLSKSASLELLGSIVGHQPVAAHLKGAQAVVRYCSGLPLALRIAGSRNLGRPHRDMDSLARRLVRAPRLLDELRIGDLGVRSSLDVSYRWLHEDAYLPSGAPDPAAALRLLGAVGAVNADAGLVAELLGCSWTQAEASLEVLADAHLVVDRGDGCYHLDPLLRAYARERAEGAEGPGSRARNPRTPPTTRPDGSTARHAALGAPLPYPAYR
ncbi:BTAD domain-containing putative transcriptional regulator [Streptomyces sp. NPDC048362]|uniref:AfsR/SARP family transcriptional regulator n=1 Tax=Streptomyces sp. NPDC048362 TaxID=3365539 RepID=UPI00371368BC